MKKIFALLMLPLMLLCACSDDKTPADANENFITSVILTVGDNSYDAVIADGTITVTVPYTVSLDGATASFAYTPSAKIYPNPQEITNWNEERIFRVVSYNGDERQYTYTVIKDEIREDGDVVLKNAAEIAAFADKGISVINGNLTIGTESGEEIATLEGLENLKEVSGIITILDSYKGTDLTGFDNLKSIGGLTIGTTETNSTIPLNLFTLNSLENVSGDINIYANSLEYVDFKGLTKIGGSVHLASANLKSIQAENLTEITGDFIVSCKNNKAPGGTIKEISLPALTTVGGSISGSDFAELETISFPHLQTSGSIAFEDIPFSLHKIEFPDINTIEGDLIFKSITQYSVIGDITTGNTNLLSFDGFDKLQKVSGTVCLSAFTEVINIPNVTNATIGGLYLERMLKIKNLDLSNTKFTKPTDKERCDVKIVWMPINKITGSKSMDCNIIFENVDFAEYNGFPTLENIETLGGLYVGQPNRYVYDKVFTISTSIKEITGNLHIDMCTHWDNVLVNMPALTKVQGYVFIFGAQIRFDTFFPMLTYVGGQLYVGGKGLINYDYSALKEVSTATTSTKLAIEVLFDLGKDFEKGRGLNMYFTQGEQVSFNSLEKVGGKGMELNLCYGKTPIKSLSCPKLESIASELILYSKPYEDDCLTEMDFAALSACPKVTITDFQELSDFSSFGKLFTNGQISNSQNWIITGCKYNPTFEDMKAGKYKLTQTKGRTNVKKKVRRN